MEVIIYDKSLLFGFKVNGIGYNFLRFFKCLESNKCCIVINVVLIFVMLLFVFGVGYMVGFFMLMNIKRLDDKFYIRVVRSMFLWRIKIVDYGKYENCYLLFYN